MQARMPAVLNSKQAELAAALKMFCAQPKISFIHSVFFASCLKEAVNCISKFPFATHSRMKAWIAQIAPTDVANTIQNLRSTQRKFALNPFHKQFFDGV